MLFITLVAGSFCQGGALQKAKEPLSMPGTQSNADVRHLEQSSPEAVTWRSLTLTGFDQGMRTLPRIEVYLLDHTGPPERPFQPKAGYCLK